MLITIHGLPPNTRYTDVKSLLKEKCHLTEIILDNLVSENQGQAKKVTVGVADEGDAAILVRKINGLYLNGSQLYIEDVRKKRESDQPYRSSTQQSKQYSPSMGNQDESLAQQVYQQQWMMQQTMAAQLYAAQSYQGTQIAHKRLRPLVKTYPLPDCSQALQQPVLPYGSQTTAQGYYPDQPMQNYNQPSNFPDRNNQSFNSDKSYSGNQSYGNANQSSDGPNEGYGGGYKNYGSNDRSYNNGNQSYGGGNQSFGGSNQNNNRKNQSYDGGDHNNQRQQVGNLNPDGGNSRFDRGNQSYGGGNDTRGRGNQSFDRGNQSYSRDGPSGAVKRRPSPAPGPGLSPWANKRPKVESGTYSGFQGRRPREPSVERFVETHELPPFAQDYREQQTQGPQDYNQANNPGYNQRGFPDVKPQIRPQGTRWSATVEPKQEFHSNAGTPRKNAPNYNQNNKNRGNNSSFEQKPSNFRQNETSRPQNNPYKKVNPWAEWLNGPPNKKPVFAPKQEAPRQYIPKPFVKFSLESLRKTASGVIPDDAHKLRISTWVGQVAAAYAKEFTAKFKKELSGDQQAVVKQELRKTLTLLAENNPPQTLTELQKLYRQWFRWQTDIKWMKGVLSKYAKGILQLEKKRPLPQEQKETTLQSLLDKKITKPDGSKDYVPPGATMSKVTATAVFVPKFKQPHAEEKLPRYPNADKQVHKDLRKLRTLELETEPEELYRMPPPLKQALREECDVIQQLAKAEVEPSEEEESEVCEYLINEGLPEFDKIIRLSATKRVQNITTGLSIRVFFQPKPPKKPLLQAFMRENGVISLKQSDLKRKRFSIATCLNYEAYDKLLTSGPVTIEESTIKFKPLNNAGPKPKEINNKKQKNNEPEPSEPYVITLRTGKQVEMNKDSLDTNEADPVVLTDDNDKNSTNEEASNIDEVNEEESENDGTNQEAANNDEANQEASINNGDIQDEPNNDEANQEEPNNDEANQEDSINDAGIQEECDDMSNKNIEDYVLLDECNDDEEDCEDYEGVDFKEDVDFYEMPEDELEDFEL